MSNAIIVLTPDELSKLVERAATFAVDALRNDLAKPTPELMTKGELAEYLRCDVSKINRYMKLGLPFESFGGHPRYRKSDIDRWLKNERVQEIQAETALSP